MKPEDRAKAMLASLKLGEAVLESIPEAGMPSGHLYAALMGTGITLDAYEGMLSGFLAAAALTKTGHQLRRGENYTQALTNLRRTIAHLGAQ